MAVVYEQKTSDCEVFTFFGGGVIFISIDDNEQAPLKLLCDEIFGSNNFITNLLWQSTPGSNTGKAIKTVTEYVLMYAKQKEKLNINSKPVDDIKKYKFKDEHLEFRGPYVTNKLDRRMTGSHYSEALNYPIDMPDGTLLYPGCLTEKQDHWNWRWSRQKVEWGVANDFILFEKKKGKWAIYFKQYLKVDNNDIAIERSLPYQNLVLEDAMNAARGTREVMDIFSEKKFDYPKPLALISFILNMASKQNSTILDFFAGSGTTLHATMQLNAEDGGHRKCILVTNNENNICEEVTYERNKRVIQGYTTPKGEEVEGLHDNNLRYYRTNFLSRDKSVKNMRQLVRLATDMLCIKNDVYTEAEFCGKKINPNIARYFDNGQGNRMLVIYEERAIQLLVQLMAQTEDDGIKTMVYVFSPGADPYTDDFEDIAERVKLCALPSAIYEAYKRVLPKRKPKFLDEALQEMKAQAEAEANAQQTLDFGENDNMNEEGGEA